MRRKIIALRCQIVRKSQRIIAELFEPSPALERLLQFFRSQFQSGFHQALNRALGFSGCSAVSATASFRLFSQ
jgi:hypothetical protein